MGQKFAGLVFLACLQECCRLAKRIADGSLIGCQALFKVPDGTKGLSLSCLPFLPSLCSLGKLRRLVERRQGVAAEGNQTAGQPKRANAHEASSSLPRKEGQKLL